MMLRITGTLISPIFLKLSVACVSLFSFENRSWKDRKDDRSVSQSIKKILHFIKRNLLRKIKRSFTLSSFLSVLFPSFCRGKDSDRNESSVKKKEKRETLLSFYYIQCWQNFEENKLWLAQEKQIPGTKESWLNTVLCWSKVEEFAVRWFCSLLAWRPGSHELLLLLLLLLCAEDCSGLGLSETACRHSTLLPLARTLRLGTIGVQEIYAHSQMSYYRNLKIQM